MKKDDPDVKSAQSLAKVARRNVDDALADRIGEVAWVGTGGSLQSYVVIHLTPADARRLVEALAGGDR